MPAPTGYTTVSASKLADAGHNLVANATIYFQPVTSAGVETSFKAGGAGAVTSTPVPATVTNGAFTIDLADTTLTQPVNIGYRVTVIDNVTGKSLLGPGYGCVQPSGPTWSLDDYSANIASIVTVQTGPRGPQGLPNTISIGTVTSNPVPSATIAGVSPNQVLNLVLPKGDKGDPGDVSGPQVIAVKGATTSSADNLFNSAVTTTNSYIDYTNGTVHGFTGFTVTPYMIANPGGQMVCNQNIISQSPSGIAFFDITGTYISGIGTGVAAGTPFLCPANAVYVRFSVKNTDFNAASMMVVWGSTVPSSYVSFAKASSAELTAAVGALNTSITTSASTTLTSAITGANKSLQAVNRFNSATVTPLKYIDPRAGNVASVSAGFENLGVSDYIPVIGGGTVTMSFGLPAISNGVGLAFYNGTTYISGVNTVVAIPAGVPIAVPATATNMRTTLVTADAPTVMICQGSALPSQYVPYNSSLFSQLAIAIVDPRIASAIAAAISTVGQPLLGKKYAVIGDSITQQAMWQAILESKTGMVKVYQNARSGRPISHAFDDYTGTGNTFVDNGDIAGYVGCTVGNTFAQDMAATAPDVLFIELGTNDGDTPTGTQADINNGTTWWGRVNSVVSAVLAARPAMKVIFITPYQINPAAYPTKWDSTAPAKLADMVTAIKYICGLSGCTVVDLLHESGINQYNWSTLLQDGIHINTAGANYGFVPQLIAGLRKIFA